MISELASSFMSAVGGSKQRLVVVGDGMATARLLEEMAISGALETYDVTVVGDEPYPAYNRVLLSSVLEGRHTVDSVLMRTPEWYAEQGITLRTGVRATGIDRDRRRVHLGDGTRLPYDRLVLATGGAPVLPPLRGVIRRDNKLHPRVFAFRSLDDCQRLVAALDGGAKSAVVVGGGLLGLEAARGLIHRGLTVDVVEVAEHLMHRQLHPEAGRALRQAVKGLGIGVHTEVRAVGLIGDDENLTGVRMDDGYVLGADLVVFACGMRPNAHLAREAGLDVGVGVVVDDRLTTSDPAVYALGDCAEHRGETVGLVAPAWDQARVLAAVLAGDETSAYEGSRLVTRLRASNLDVAVVGSIDAEPTDEVVEFANPLRGVYRRLVLREGRLRGAVVLGELTTVGMLAQYFDRDAPLPPDPTWVLFGDRVSSAA